VSTVPVTVDTRRFTVFFVVAPGIAKVATVEDLLLQRDVLIYIHEVRQQLQQAENRMKQVYAKGHQEQ
jgi:hypothetical protein